jgi:hypothetical protein
MECFERGDQICEKRVELIVVIIQCEPCDGVMALAVYPLGNCGRFAKARWRGDQK